MPFPISRLQQYLYRRNLLSKLEILDIAERDDVSATVGEIYESLSDLLGNKKYFFGNRPSSLDAVVLGHLMSHQYAQIPENYMRDQLRNHQNLENYVNSLTKELFGSVPNVDSATKALKEVCFFN